MAAYLALCLVLFSALALLTWAYGYTVWLPAAKVPLLKLYVYVCCAGSLGAVLYCIRSLYKHVSQGDYDRGYAYWYLFRPWMGAVLGMSAYFFVMGGLMAFECKFPDESFRAKALFIALAFLAGFSANEFIMKINAVAKALFGADDSTPGATAGAGKPGAGPRPAVPPVQQGHHG